MRSHQQTQQVAFACREVPPAAPGLHTQCNPQAMRPSVSMAVQHSKLPPPDVNHGWH